MDNTREKLIELLGDVQSFGCKHTYEETASSMGFRENDEVANHLIANGVKIPVLCKECKHWCHMEDGFGDCTNGRFHIDGHADSSMKAEGFCSCGERREEI